MFETVTPLEDPVVRETTLVLREWNGIWKNLYVVRILKIKNVLLLTHALYSSNKRTVNNYDYKMAEKVMVGNCAMCFSAVCFFT